MEKNKVLIIRFSSFGDIVQCSSVINIILEKFTKPSHVNEIHWATRSDFESLVKLNMNITQVWALEKKMGILGLLKFALKLRAENYSHVYDAHNNLRSTILKLFLITKFNQPKLITRSKDRFKRILLFNFRINRFPKPFKGINSFIIPLNKWGIELPNKIFVRWLFSSQVKEKILSIINHKKFIALVPSAAWEMKRWPISHWKELIIQLPNENFIILGGKEDHNFCQEIEAIDPSRVKSFAGELSLIESCQLISQAQLVISADTGLLHVADVLNILGISLMGPTAFGYTTGKNIKTLEVEMACRPCSKDGSGKCSQEIWQKCMTEILPARVANEVLNLIHE